VESVTTPEASVPPRLTRLLGRQVLVLAVGLLLYAAALIPAVELGGWLSVGWLVIASPIFLFIPPRLAAPGPAQTEKLAGRIRAVHALDGRLALAAVLFGSFAVTRRLVWFTLMAPGEGPILEPPRGIPIPMAALVVLAVVFAPVGEEVVFRGWLQTPLEGTIGPVASILVAAALFGAIHLDGWDGIDHFVAGALCGYFVWRTGSLWAGIALHAANNLAWVCVALLVSSEAELERMTAAWLPGWAAALVSIAILGALIRLAKPSADRA
jgi:membrane protease YdiL (CAAX protease family)